MHTVTFVRSIGTASQFAGCVELPLGDVAVVGRSNVGKSSLINFMVGSAIARTSRTPGRTRLINLFSVDDSFMLVDLPGYGYARGEERERKTWAPLIEGFVRARKSIRGFLLLMDARHFPLDVDAEAAAWMEELEKPYVVVLTKFDKLNQREQSALKHATPDFFETHPHAIGPVYTSVLKSKGREELLKCLQMLLSDSSETIEKS